MTTTELPIAKSKLTALAQALATIGGIGASFGLGIATLSLRGKMAEFVDANHLPLSARMGLLRIILVSIAAAIVAVALVVLGRPNDPNRLATLERAASRLSPLAALGLCPLFYQSGLWKTNESLFLAAMLGYAVLLQVLFEPLDFGILGKKLSQFVTRKSARIPGGAVDAVALVGITILVVLSVKWGFTNHSLSSELRPRPLPAQFLAQLRALGHGGYLVAAALMATNGPNALQAHRLLYLVLVSSAAIPLYLYSASKLGKWAGLLVAVFYLGYPPLLVAGTRQPDSLALAAPFFFLCAYAWEQRRTLLAVLSTIILLGIHEQTAMWLLCLGGVLVYRSPGYRAAQLLAFGAALYFAVMAIVLLPHWGIESYGSGFRSIWSSAQPGLRSTLTTMVTNPVYAASRFFEQKDADFTLYLFVPFALLTFRSRTWLLWLLPYILFGIIGQGHFPTLGWNHPAVAHYAVLGHVAAVIALETIKRNGDGERRMRAMLWAWGFALLPCICAFGCLSVAAP